MMDVWTVILLVGFVATAWALSVWVTYQMWTLARQIAALDTRLTALEREWRG